MKSENGLIMSHILYSNLSQNPQIKEIDTVSSEPRFPFVFSGTVINRVSLTYTKTQTLFFLLIQIFYRFHEYFLLF